MKINYNHNFTPTVLCSLSFLLLWLLFYWGLNPLGQFFNCLFLFFKKIFLPVFMVGNVVTSILSKYFLKDRCFVTVKYESAILLGFCRIWSLPTCNLLQSLTHDRDPNSRNRLDDANASRGRIVVGGRRFVIGWWIHARNRPIATVEARSRLIADLRGC